MITLVPAYGRDYKSKEAVIKDFNEGKDFKICDAFSAWDGRYANKADLIKDHDEVKVRYDQLRKSVFIPID